MPLSSRRLWIQILSVFCLAYALVLFTQVSGVSANPAAQIPTGSVATVTGTPIGAIAVVLDNEQGKVNVRNGPGTLGYDIIGALIPGQQIPALGRSAGGDWIKIVYPGVPGGVAWVYTPLVELKGQLPIVEPPPTQTPASVPTIDPTLAAQFLKEVPPTRLPTFTAPAPLVVATFAVESQVNTPSRVPMGFVIIGMAAVGLFGALISFLRGR